MGEEVVPHTLHVHRLAGPTRGNLTSSYGGCHVEKACWGQLKVQQNVFKGFV